MSLEYNPKGGTTQKFRVVISVFWVSEKTSVNLVKEFPLKLEDYRITSDEGSDQVQWPKYPLTLFMYRSTVEKQTR